MTAITASELELLSFFEAEPRRLDPAVPWVYNELVYEGHIGALSFTFTLQPSCKDVSMLVRRGQSVLYELQATEVEDLLYHKDAAFESLEIVISSRDRVWLRMKPVIYVGHEVSASGA